ncbi:putative C2H2 finger domain protein [Aspergillus saccharolyticus JOP 1030-1]|uniref:C2H2-type domain-containing protein n=1 Tax=Aspergillus saccharolyticus JOP 1030-1 TaxID=1450539 RepID=A0A318ZJV8_9EURO|nr:hypothetical protein BP01DRAFT_381689 [Aspergillus saccharolyticus JOP 1030-1]PYH46664.1 hypothetical protein BP01DRAFT_381689 [Aspergillus saccharolyticus JOP 1030-1]
MMRTSEQDALWEDSDDILRGINGSRAMPRSSHKGAFSCNGPTLPEICLDDSASFTGVSFDSKSALHQHNPSPMFDPCFAVSNPALSPSAQDIDFSQYSLARFSADQDAWTPLKLTGLTANVGTLMCPPMGTSHYWSGLDRRLSTGHYSTPSEADSQQTSLHPSESGYSTQSGATRSVATPYPVDSACSPYSGPFELEQDEGISVLDLNTGPNDNSIDALERMQSPSLICPEAIRCDYSDCRWTGKCPSDKRKHEARHRKSFKCDEPNCTRKDGFGTINDLARHKKCVHKQEPERGPKVLYMCFGTKCPRKDKRWPRLDNFRQHLARMHHDEDAEELLRKSHEWYDDCVKPQVIASSYADCLSEASSPQMPEAADEPQSSARDYRTAPSFSPAKARMELVMKTSGSVGDEQRRSSISHATSKPEISGSQTVKLPVLNGLSLDGPINPEVSLTARLDTPRDEKKDDMVAEAASNLINAMTKSMNISQRRQGQRANDTDIDMEPEVDLTEPKREILQMILTAALEILNQSSEPCSSHPPLDKESSSVRSGQRKWIQCDFCSKKTRLRCEMKKHQKRHERPYSCTFPQCSKTFGSKNDWKRHENSQHFHSKSWGCTLPDATQEGVTCDRLFYRQETYVQHLKKLHMLVKEEEIRSAVSDNRICHDGRTSFWCGFCRDDVPLSQGFEAWNERFTHIDSEHYKRGERIENWVLPSYQLSGDGEQDEGKPFIRTKTGCESEPNMDGNSEGNCPHNDAQLKDGTAFSHEDQIMLDDYELLRDRVPEQRRNAFSLASSQPNSSERPTNTRKRKHSIIHSDVNSGSSLPVQSENYTSEIRCVSGNLGECGMNPQSQAKHTPLQAGWNHPMVDDMYTAFSSPQSGDMQWTDHCC